jgi:hypothetical protein
VVDDDELRAVRGLLDNDAVAGIDGDRFNAVGFDFDILTTGKDMAGKPLPALGDDQDRCASWRTFQFCPELHCAIQGSV